ncbi:MAG: dienelactone hydrolase family protein, partial [Caulobacteraceae bacterium]
MIERELAISTRDGAMQTFIVHPERHGPHPFVLFFMDAPGIREELRDMARRIAAVGHYVMLPNLYYREGVKELSGAPRERYMELMESLSIPKVMSDAAALISFSESDA